MMRLTENNARQELSMCARPKMTHKVMPLKQRLVLEALKRRRHATIYAIGEDLFSSREALKNVFATLEDQGYVERVGTSPSLRGRARGVFKWTGKQFPPARELSPNHRLPIDGMPAEIATLVAGMRAMCFVGRAAV